MYRLLHFFSSFYEEYRTTVGYRTYGLVYQYCTKYLTKYLTGNQEASQVSARLIQHPMLARSLRLSKNSARLGSLRLFSNENLGDATSAFSLGFTEEQNALKDLARKFTAEEVGFPLLQLSLGHKNALNPHTISTANEPLLISNLQGNTSSS